MKKYMVVVNRKVMVQVEATSNAAAEHMVLDGIKHFIKSALAFDPVTESSYYGWAFENCKMMSYGELKAKANASFAKVNGMYNELLEIKMDLDEEVRKLENDLEIKRMMAQSAAEEAEDFRKRFDLEMGFMARERLEALQTA